MILGGPALYLLGESLFGWRITGAMDANRLAVAALLLLLVPLGGQLSVLLLSLIVATLLLALAGWEVRASGVEAAARAA
jgi:low temperature requirement protein LtrA